LAITSGAASARVANALLVGAKTVIPSVVLRGSTRLAWTTRFTREEKVSELLIAISTTVCGAMEATDSGALGVGTSTPSMTWMIPLFARMSAATTDSPLTIAVLPIKLNEMLSPCTVVKLAPFTISEESNIPGTT